MGNCLSNIFIQRGMDLIFRFLQLRQSNTASNLSHSPNPEGPLDDIQDEIRAEGAQRVRIEVPKQELTEALLQEYLELERTARRLERKQVLSNWETKNHLADEAMRKLVHLEARHKELKKQTEKARTDLEHLEQPGIRAHLRQQGIYVSRHERAKELSDSAIVKEETSFKELATVKSEYSRAQLVANRYREKCEKLEKAHQKQEEIFCEWNEIHKAYLIIYPGLTSWEELQQINGARSRYFTAVEARNNFVNSINNIQSCRVEKLWTQTRELRLELLRKSVHEKLGREIEAKELDIGEEEEDDDNFEDEEIRNEELDLNEGEVNNEEGEEENLNVEVVDEGRGLESEDGELRGEEENLRNEEEVNEGNQVELKEEEEDWGNKEEDEGSEEKSKSEEDESRNEEEELKNKEEESKNEVNEEKIREGDRRHIRRKEVIFVPHHQTASPSNSSITLSFQNPYDDAQRRIRKFEQIRYRKKNNPNNEMQRLNSLQEKLRVRRYQLERRQNEAKKLAEQFRQQWKIAIGYSSF
uniref:Pinin/SDK/MemA protein domain-containing protein n=1 Tax=Meloidogyne javanica TaxID=6303 RepID=A0A915M316_MELJA